MDYVKYIRSKVGKEKIILNAGAAVIVKDDMILLQRRSDNNRWGLIGGIMEIGETYKETALREIREETGLECSLDYLIGIYHNPNMVWASGDEGHIICAIYKASIIKGEPRIDSESLELRFFKIDELPEIAALDHRLAVKDYINGIRNNIN